MTHFSYKGVTEIEQGGRREDEEEKNKQGNSSKICPAVVLSVTPNSN